MDSENLDEKTKIEPVKSSRDYFDIDTDDRLNLGVPLWYMVRIKQNQIKMLNERGYQLKKEDLPYQTLDLGNLEQYLKIISPNTLKEDMSGVYTLKELDDKSNERELGGDIRSNFGLNIFVYYPEFKLDKDTTKTKIKTETKNIVKDIMLMLDIKLPITEKSNKFTLKANNKIYGTLFANMGGKYNSKKEEWSFPEDKLENIEFFIQENMKTPYIQRVMIISYSGLMPQARKELLNNSAYYFEEFTYSNLSYVPIEHYWAAEYKKLTPEEWDNIVLENKKVGKELNTQIIKKLYNSDVFVRYYGGFVGDIYLIKYKNYLSKGILDSKYSHIEYRVVVRDPNTVG